MSSPRAAWSSASQGGDRVEHAVVLGDDVVGAVVVDRVELAPVGVQPGHVHVAQQRHGRVVAGDGSHHPLRRRRAARCTRCRRGRCGDAAVDDDERQVVGEGHGPPVQRPAVEEQGVAGHATGGGELVHEAALHADVLVLGTLRDCAASSRGARAGPAEPDSAQAETTSRAADDDRPEPMGSAGHDDAVEAADRLAGLLHGPGGAGHVVVPLPGRGRDGVAGRSPRRPRCRRGSGARAARLCGHAGRCARPCRSRRAARSRRCSRCARR